MKFLKNIKYSVLISFVLFFSCSQSHTAPEEIEDNKETGETEEVVDNNYEMIVYAGFEDMKNPGGIEKCCGNSGDIIKPEFDARAGELVWMGTWNQDGYDGSRDSKGIELKSKTDQRIKEEGWYAASFYLPSDNFPNDKATIIMQLHAYIGTAGCCTSDCKVLTVTHNDKGELKINTHYRVEGTSNITSSSSVLASGGFFDAWNDLVIHFKFSRSGNGILEAWYNNTDKDNPSVRVDNLNFGANSCWVGDALEAGAYYKAGIYASDTKNYTSGETRIIYFDEIRYLDGNPEDAFDMVLPGTSYQYQ